MIAEKLRPAHTHWSRLKGLLGTSCLAAGEGLWLKPCRQVHMLGMRYPIDVAFLDDELHVLRTVDTLAPGKLSPKVTHATSVLELPAGLLTQLGIASGTRLAIEPDLPSSATVASEGLRRAFGNVFLAAVYLFFAAAHISALRSSGNWATILPILIQESLLALLFLTRRPTIAVSQRPLEWAIGVIGTFLPFGFRPTDDVGRLAVIGFPLQIAGLVLVILAITSLGRSIGIVPADRGVKTAGLYGVVRHPMYAAHIIAYLGYVVAYPSPRNITIAAAVAVALNMRAVFEERLLGHDPLYRSYLQRTHWRFLPHVY